MSAKSISITLPGEDRARSVDAGQHDRAATRDPAFLRGLVLGLRGGILAVDREGNLVLLNDPARQILELDGVEPGCGKVEEALGDYPELARVLRDSFTMSSLPNRAEIDLRCRSGEQKTIGFTLSLVAGDNGAPVGAAMFFKDLTHVEHREEQERLKDRLASLGEMAANLAHEIRNPLASIEVSCSLLKRRFGSTEGAQDLLAKIIAEVRRLNGSITSSLEFVRPISLSLACHALEDVLDEAVSVAHGRRGRAGIRIDRRYSRQLQPFLMDREQLRQVFENLFLNALEAMGENGVLTIEADTAPAPDSASTPYVPEGQRGDDPFRSADRFAVVRVSDTGPGISHQHRDKLFYPFFTTKKHGSGVGLSTARKIVDLHRGVLDLESTPGQGATFIVRIPVAVQNPEDENS
jgi:signal transduction histidine kinase